MEIEEQRIARCRVAGGLSLVAQRELCGRARGPRVRGVWLDREGAVRLLQRRFAAPEPHRDLRRPQRDVEADLVQPRRARGPFQLAPAP